MPPRPPAPPNRPVLRPWQERVSTLRADVQAGPAVHEPASTASSRPASTPNALPPPQPQKESTGAPAPRKEQEAPPPPQELIDDCPAIYLTSLGGDSDAPPLWEPPPAPWGASLAGLPTWDDVQLQ